MTLGVRGDRAQMRKVIVAASLGTAFEWYDFFIYAFLAVFFSGLFFPKGNATGALLASMATFAAGFIVRPLGAMVFGSLGDKLGRKRTFLITIVMMGLGTAGIGLILPFERIGWAAPILLVCLRLLQGFSLGGEYSGAGIYAVEHAVRDRRGRQTGWLQFMPSVGQLVAIGVIAAAKALLDPHAFAAWGWRIPFLLSLPFLAISVYIRLQLEESPIFQDMKASGRLASAPVREALGSWSNLKVVLPGFALCAAQGVALYTGQLHAFYFVQTVLKVDPETANSVETIVIAAVIPITMLVAVLSDFVGRKWLMVAGATLAALTTFPIFHAMTHYANPALEQFNRTNRIVVAGRDCKAPLFDVLNAPKSPCQKATAFLGRQGADYTIVAAAGGQPVTVTIGRKIIAGFQPPAYGAALKAAAFPTRADPKAVNWPMLTALLLLVDCYGILIWAPLAVFLTEQFPARIRYTSVAVTANLGAGWFGGSAPLLISAISLRAGDMYYGLWFPVAVAGLGAAIGAAFVRDRTGCDIEA